MKQQKNILLNGSNGKPIALDIFLPEIEKAPVVIYAHGFNGFKDWANFDLIATQFAAAGFCFIKFNFSHNGTTPEHPEDFVDAVAFGNNNYTKELDDLQSVIDWATDATNPYAAALDTDELYLIGHSRGGGIVLIKAAEETKVKKVVAWASVSECKTPWGHWAPERIASWKETGVDYYENSRTHQKLPLYFQLYENYQQNQSRLDILNAVSKIQVPVLLCHGIKDEAVPVSDAHKLSAASKNAKTFLLSTDHVFGRKHPWTEPGLPGPMQLVVERTISFFKLYTDATSTAQILQE